ncbi:MAG: nitronate monooxygenase [Thermodesulfobacteriota bacterium]|nr:nitronate monooxygenase [Thermodesulfobacteriota bacterium]
MKNRITEILGTAYPLILGPMRLITLGEMAAMVSKSGGFGQVAASGATKEILRSELKKARELTDRPIGVNIPVYRPNALEALEIAIEMGVQTITTSAGSPAKMMDRIKDAGLKVLHKVSSLEMGLKAQDAGVDGVIATGHEAGGHIGRDDTTTLILIPQLVDALEIPVVAAGGIGDARGLIAALALGAEGIEAGTRFLATRECSVPNFWKQSVVEAKGKATLVLGEKAMPVRVLRNKKALHVSDPDKAKEDARIMEAGDKDFIGPDDNAESSIIPAGQVAGLIREIKAVAEVFPRMVADAKVLSSKIYALFKEED